MKTYSMKSVFLSSALLLSLSILLTACPFSTKFPLAEKEDVSSFDKRLIGEWINTDTTVVASKIKITKGETKKTYHIQVLEKGAGFAAESDEFDAWITEINNNKFMVLQEIKDPGAEKTYYVYHIEMNDNNLITHDILLKVRGTDAITSVSSYREEVRTSSTFKNFLTEEIKWTKE
jgi:hypothetical protein